MPYSATVYLVMIASPSDVQYERTIIRDAILEWNAINSKDKSIVLLPVAWETHSAPRMGDRPQGIINQQVLADADLLIAAFWTRLGTPTGEAPSGSVEEIERHIAAGKPAMLYFSSAPLPPDSVDRDQYDALTAFKKTCRQRGLCETYEAISDFERMVNRQLAIIVRDHFAAGDTPVVTPQQVTDPILAISNRLSTEGKELLRNACEDKNGSIIRVRTTGGLAVQANGKNFTELKNARSEARWESVVDELYDYSLIARAGSDGHVFNVTHKGYQVADKLASME